VRIGGQFSKGLFGALCFLNVGRICDLIFGMRKKSNTTWSSGIVYAWKHIDHAIESGTDATMIFIISTNKMAKNWRFLLETKLNDANFLIITLFFEKNANFSAENWQKSRKIVIVTSTPG
jgi:hypothetical protein